MRLAAGTLPRPWIDPDMALPWAEKQIELAFAASQIDALTVRGGAGLMPSAIIGMLSMCGALT
jgi:hypothetical protein